MGDVRGLMLKFIEDRESLSDEELQQLVAQLSSQPALAAELKDQLSVEDLLEQKFDLTRLHFMLQVDQRLRDETREFSGMLPAIGLPEPEENELPAVDEPRKVVRKEEARKPQATPSVQAAEVTPPRRRRTYWPYAVAALLILGAAGAALLLWSNPTVPLVARLESIKGEVRLLDAAGNDLPSGVQEIRPGDQLKTTGESTAYVRFPDGTTLDVRGDTLLQFPAFAVAGDQKRLFLEHGRLSADVAPQPAGKPMIFGSPLARAEVLGTKLTLFVEADDTHLKVTEGRVRLVQMESGKSVVVAQGEIGVASEAALSKAPESWPSDRAGLLFLFETNDRANQVLSTASGLKRSYTVRPRGRARLNHDAAMVLDGGAFLANDVDGEILAACQQTNELSVEATIIPSVAKQSGPARIVTFSTDVSQRDFTLGQEGDELIVRIRTPQTGRNGVGDTDKGVRVATLKAGKANHVIVSYKPGLLVCYLNGQKVFEGDPIQGDFRDWSAQHLLFGDEYGGQRDWLGTLEGIAIYNRFIPPDEAAKNALQCHDRQQSRPKVPQTRVQAKLLQKSAIPPLKAILPHRAALVVYKYHVEKTLSGPSAPDEIYVSHWALLDGERQPIADLAVGAEMEFLLEPLAQNPQVAPYFCSDDFNSAGDASAQRYLEAPR